jgi:hypothetical protein
MDWIAMEGTNEKLFMALECMNTIVYPCAISLLLHLGTQYSISRYFSWASFLFLSLLIF